MNPNRTLFIRRGVLRRLRASLPAMLLGALISIPVIILSYLARSVK